ncbi:MAG: NAD(P) transhydrogenase subunit alpha [Bacteroidota bacterium]
MKIGILKEVNDNRVAVVPTTLKKNKAIAKFFVVENGAGLSSGFSDKDYEEFCTTASRSRIIEDADVLLSIHPISQEEMDKAKKQCIYISLFESFNHPEIIPELERHQLQGFSLDMIPRTTLAQSMDVLSSMASVAGYKAVLAAAHHLDRYFPMMMTAAGTIRPAKVLVLGAGVAGLQAIATARKLGAMVEAFDVRKASKEEVESLGAKFVEVEGAKDDSAAGGYAVEQSEDFIQRQKKEVQDRAIRSDVIIATAQLRGRKAPILVEAATVESMQSGSVIVDLAASTGGNCALTKNGEIYNHNGVVIIGNSNLPADMPKDASTLFSNNAMNFLKLMVDDEGKLNVDLENEILKSAKITK